MWLDDEEGCQKSDADAYCKLKLCDPDATSTNFRIMEDSNNPGFACRGHGRNLGNWFGMKDVWFKEDIRSSHYGGSVVTEVSCEKTGSEQFIYLNMSNILISRYYKSVIITVLLI